MKETSKPIWHELPNCKTQGCEMATLVGDYCIACRNRRREEQHVAELKRYEQWAR
jgi:hypothetical protein